MLGAEKSFDDAFRHDIDPFSGGWRVAAPSVKRSISQLTRDASKFWIGIASNGDEGCRTRWNAKYKGLGMKSIATVYRTDSDDFRRDMEDELIDFYKEHCDNIARGGGGPRGTPPYTVYVAWK